MSVPATSANFGDLLIVGFRKIFNGKYTQTPSKIGQLYSMKTSIKACEDDTEVGAFGDLENFTQSGKISYDSIEQGYNTRYTHIEWARGFQVQYRLYKDDQYGIMNKMPEGLALAATRTKEKRAAYPFNNAFTIGMSDSGGSGDGVSLCNSEHPVPDGSFTWSNTGTTALSQASLEATRLLMQGFKDDRGNLISTDPKILLIPSALEKTAKEIIGTDLEVGTANNTINVSKGAYQIIRWDVLTDNNNWFLIDKDLASMFLNFFTRESTQFDQDKDFDTKIAKFSVYDRYSLGYSNPRFIYGHSVS